MDGCLPADRDGNQEVVRVTVCPLSTAAGRWTGRTGIVCLVQLVLCALDWPDLCDLLL
jgi:hypothetical protein